MAEVLGIAAAAIQIADTALKFKKLCSDIKHVSGDLSCLAEEVTVLASILGEVEKSSTCCLTASSPAWQQCTHLFKLSAESMNQVIVELDKTLKAHRVTGSIRIYMKKDELDRCRDRLERTKGIMMLAQQAYSCAVLTQQNETILSKIHAVATCQSLQAPALSITADTDSTQNLTIRKESKGDDAETDSNRRTNRRSHHPASKKATSSYNIRIPSWIFRTGFRILVDRSNQSWSFTIRSYNQLPRGSRVFHLAGNGDWDGVRSLMDLGEASPWDVDPNGCTLLHVAAQQGDVNTCAFLLNLGLDPSMHLGPVRDVLSFFTSLVRAIWFWNPKQHPPVCAIISLLLSHSDLVLELNDIHPWDGSAFLEGVAKDSLSVLLDATVPSYSSLDKFTRAQLACATRTGDPEAVILKLGPDLTLHQAFDVLERGSSSVNHHSLLVIASQALGYQFALLDQDQSIIRGWEAVIRSVVEYESHCTSSINWRSSLLGFLRGYCNTLGGVLLPKRIHVQCWNDFFTQIGRIWVGLLRKMGVDLLRYGAAEKAYFSSTKSVLSHIDPWWIWTTPKSSTIFDLRYLTYGPETCEWSLYVVPVANEHLLHRCTVEYEMAGRFWDWIENPELYKVPGTFIADDIDDIYDDRYTKIIVQGPTL